MNAIMARAEPEDLQRLVRQREKVLKSATKQRSAADFENQMVTEYSFDQDEVWRQAAEAAEREVTKAQRLVAARCHELGIPDRFAPSLHLTWHHQGYDNRIEDRRKELRRMAQPQIAANEQREIVQIEISCLDAQTQLAMAGLTSEAARAFVDRLPAIDTLMPRLSFAEVADEAEPPIAELSPNALRQRRFRDRQAALLNASAPLRNADETAVMTLNGRPSDERARHDHRNHPSRKRPRPAYQTRSPGARWHNRKRQHRMPHVARCHAPHGPARLARLCRY